MWAEMLMCVVFLIAIDLSSQSGQGSGSGVPPNLSQYPEYFHHLLTSGSQDHIPPTSRVLTDKEVQKAIKAEKDKAKKLQKRLEWKEGEAERAVYMALHHPKEAEARNEKKRLKLEAKMAELANKGKTKEEILLEKKRAKEIESAKRLQELKAQEAALLEARNPYDLDAKDEIKRLRVEIKMLEKAERARKRNKQMSIEFGRLRAQQGGFPAMQDQPGQFHHPYDHHVSEIQNEAQRLGQETEMAKRSKGDLVQSEDNSLLIPNMHPNRFDLHGTSFYQP